jgi:hypothetical protein
MNNMPPLSINIKIICTAGKQCRKEIIFYYYVFKALTNEFTFSPD